VNLHFRRTDDAPASDAPVGTPIDSVDGMEAAAPEPTVDLLAFAADDDTPISMADPPNDPARADEPVDPVTEPDPAEAGWPAMSSNPEPGDAGAGLTRPNGWSDPVTSADGPHYWDRLLSSERDRVRRYRRPATVVFIEVVHLDRLGTLWGEDVAAQSLVRVGRTIMRQTRSSDHTARIDVARFGVFLPETNEIAAINFVERVRAAIDEALGLMAETVRVAIGWASPTDGNLDSAIELAEARLAAELAAED
jgi:diguanylate cyclase (GGDEF)-like protein